MSILLSGIAVGLMSVLGFATPLLAGDTSATMEKMKGESRALVEEGKRQTKGGIEDAAVWTGGVKQSVSSSS